MYTRRIRSPSGSFVRFRPWIACWNTWTRSRRKASVALSVYFRDTKGPVESRRISLRPEKSGGATWREAVDGWGLVQVQLKFLHDSLVECRIAANSEKRAAAWASSNAAMDAPGLWDWKLVDKHVSRLIRVLRRAAAE